MCCGYGGVAARAGPRIWCIRTPCVMGRSSASRRRSTIIPVLRIEQALRRMDHYSTLAADMLVARGKRVSFSSGIGHGLWSFLRTYILRAGFLDGREGFLLAVANAEGTYYKYMKAWLAGRRRK